MPWQTFGAAMLKIESEIGEMKGILIARTDQLTHRLDRLEDRFNAMPRSRPTLSDLLPWAYGILILVAAALGKISLLEAFALLKSGN